MALTVHAVTRYILKLGRTHLVLLFWKMSDLPGVMYVYPVLEFLAKTVGDKYYYNKFRQKIDRSKSGRGKIKDNLMVCKLSESMGQAV